MKDFLANSNSPFAVAYRQQHAQQVFDGRHITITRWPDGSLHPHLKPIGITTGIDIVSYASEVANELVWALESLVEK